MEAGETERGDGSADVQQNFDNFLVFIAVSASRCTFVFRLIKTVLRRKKVVRRRAAAPSPASLPRRDTRAVTR